MAGSYTQSGNSLHIGPAITTRMMCEPEMMKVEDTFLKVLNEADHFRISGDHLEILKGDQVLAKLEALYL